MRNHLPNILLLAGLSLAGSVSYADEGETAKDPSVTSDKTIQVFASPTCGCCKDWVSHLEHHGYEVKTEYLEDMQAKKNELGVPGKLRSCHTGIINGIVIEGHVPAADIAKTVAYTTADPSANIAGITVPGMPHGSPGMETGRSDSFATVGYTHDGQYGVVSEYGNQ